MAGFEYTKNIAPNLSENGIPLFKGKNIQDITIIYEFESFIPESVSDELQRSQITKKCILTPYVGTIGNIGIHNRSGKYHLGSNVGKIELYNDNVTMLEEYVVSYLQSWLGYQQLTKHMKATAQASISIEAIREVYLPIPPANEQLRIWEALSKALTFIDCIANTESDIVDLITIAKSRILDLAIRGKLVPQDPNDEPAFVLLERIRAEKEELIKQGKIKRDKKESVIFKGEDNSYYEKIGQDIVSIDSEIPFEIPENWIFTRLENVLSYEQPTPYIVKTTDYNNEYSTPVLTAGKSFVIGYTNETDSIKNDLPVIIFDDFTTDSKYVDFPFKVKSSAMKILTANENIIDTKYAYYAMQIIECDSYNHKRYWLSEFSKKLIPLPPYEEQIKIVKIAENIFDNLDNIIN